MEKDIALCSLENLKGFQTQIINDKLEWFESYNHYVEKTLNKV